MTAAAVLFWPLCAVTIIIPRSTKYAYVSMTVSKILGTEMKPKLLKDSLLIFQFLYLSSRSYSIISVTVTVRVDEFIFSVFCLISFLFPSTGITVDQTTVYSLHNSNCSFSRLFVCAHLCTYLCICMQLLVRFWLG